MKTLLSQSESETLLKTLKARFEAHMNRHENLEWSKISERLQEKQDKLYSLHQMEETGGEPDVVGYDDNEDKYIFFDCSVESPRNRRSLPYDRDAVSLRTKDRPKYNAVELADLMGIDILTEEEYKKLQELGRFDAKSSSWIHTPSEITKLGGSLFCDVHYGRVFTYHNNAQLFYASRGFRGVLKV
ncbi:DUF4256 domain-containing protein [Brumimicrobium mesophilum]|uniref:DUF4256 domain-containing protein n=1 Tax=Brumimicrobium mesophilum TaxID=392717 RepID=UPI000D144404|nr:DUF4256 domain-containing protein [Brumimicrobium mesophilum]